MKDAVNTVWWLSKNDFPKANVENVLIEYSESMKTLLKLGRRTASPIHGDNRHIRSHSSGSSGHRKKTTQHLSYYSPSADYGKPYKHHISNMMNTRMGCAHPESVSGCRRQQRQADYSKVILAFFFALGFLVFLASANSASAREYDVCSLDHTYSQVVQVMAGGHVDVHSTLTATGSEPCIWQYNYIPEDVPTGFSLNIIPSTGQVATSHQITSTIRIGVDASVEPGVYYVGILVQAVCVYGSCEGRPFLSGIEIEVIVQPGSEEPPTTPPPEPPPDVERPPPRVPTRPDWQPPREAIISQLTCPKSVELQESFRINGVTYVNSPSPTFFQLRIYVGDYLLEVLVAFFEGEGTASFSTESYIALRTGEPTFTFELWSFNEDLRRWVLEDRRTCVIEFTRIATTLTLVHVPSYVCLSQVWNQGVEMAVKLSRQRTGEAVNGETVELWVEGMMVSSSPTDSNGLAHIRIPPGTISSAGNVSLQLRFGGTDVFAPSSLEGEQSFKPSQLVLRFPSQLPSPVVADGESYPIGPDGTAIIPISDLGTTIEIPETQQQAKDRRLRLDGAPQLLVRDLVADFGDRCELDVYINYEIEYSLLAKDVVQPLIEPRGADTVSADGVIISWYPEGALVKVSAPCLLHETGEVRDRLYSYRLDGVENIIQPCTQGHMSIEVLMNKPHEVSFERVRQYLVSVQLPESWPYSIRPRSPTGDSFFDVFAEIEVSIQTIQQTEEDRRRVLTELNVNNAKRSVNYEEFPTEIVSMQLSSPTLIKGDARTQFRVKIVRNYVDEGRTERIQDTWVNEGETIPLGIVPMQLTGGPGTVYRLLNPDIVHRVAVADQPTTFELLYGTYYELVVATPFGEASGGGFYRKGEVAEWWVSPSTWPVECFLGLLGGYYEPETKEGVAVMNEPKEIHVGWKQNLNRPLLFFSLAGAGAGGYAIAASRGSVPSPRFFSRVGEYLGSGSIGGCRCRTSGCRCWVSIDGPEYLIVGIDKQGRYTANANSTCDVHCKSWGRASVGPPGATEKRSKCSIKWSTKPEMDLHVSDDQIDQPARDTEVHSYQIILQVPTLDEFTSRFGDPLSVEAKIQVTAYASCEFTSVTWCISERDAPGAFAVDRVTALDYSSCKDTKIVTISATCAALKGRIEELKAQKARLEKQLAEKEAEHQKKQGQLNQLQQETNQLQQQINAVKQDIEQLQQRIDNLQNRINSLNARLANLQAALVTAKNDLVNKMVEQKVTKKAFEEVMKKLTETVFRSSVIMYPEDPGYDTFKRALELGITKKVIVAVGYGLTRAAEVLMKGLPTPSPEKRLPTPSPGDELEKAVYEVVKFVAEEVRPSPDVDVEKIVGDAVKGVGKALKDLNSLDELENMMKIKDLEVLEKMNNIKDIEDQIKQIQEQIDDLENQINNLRNQVNQKNQELNELNNKLQQLEGKQQQLQKEIQQLEQEIQELQTQIKELDKRIKDLEEEYRRRCQGI